VVVGVVEVGGRDGAVPVGRGISVARVVAVGGGADVDDGPALLLAVEGSVIGANRPPDVRGEVEVDERDGSGWLVGVAVVGLLAGGERVMVGDGGASLGRIGPGPAAWGRGVGTPLASRARARL
jgi:hypothetical protein